MVEKVRARGRVVLVGSRAVFGTMTAVVMALATSKVSRAINTALLKRENGTDRHRNARKARRTYRFSKDQRCHETDTPLGLLSHNFCWPARALASKNERGYRARKTPAMAAGLTDHIWSMAEWLTRSAIVRRS